MSRRIPDGPPPGGADKPKPPTEGGWEGERRRGWYIVPLPPPLAHQAPSPPERQTGHVLLLLLLGESLQHDGKQKTKLTADHRPCARLDQPSVVDDGNPFLAEKKRPPAGETPAAA